jgi:hypothetical protein
MLARGKRMLPENLGGEQDLINISLFFFYQLHEPKIQTQTPTQRAAQLDHTSDSMEEKTTQEIISPLKVCHAQQTVEKHIYTHTHAYRALQTRLSADDTLSEQ